jgi:hypothetical protein
MENLMDDEARKISEMSAAELEARWAAAEPAKVSRKPRTDVNTTAGRVVGSVIDRTEEPETPRLTVRIERSFIIDRLPQTSAATRTE